MRARSLVVVAALVVAGCSDDRPRAAPAAPADPAESSPSPSRTTPSTAPPETPPSTPAPQPERERRVRGIDVSHHQGEIDWSRVAGDDVAFAYLKATEGSTFTDPRFATNWQGAARAGLRVGGYHYFTLCSDPGPQADHFVSTLDAAPDAPRELPPVVDLELLGNCDPSPEPAVMRAAVVDFVAEVERRTGQRVVVYTHPDFDERYDFVPDLDRRRWVRRPGTIEPTGDWWLWQRSDDGRVDGVAGPVDIDVMRVITPAVVDTDTSRGPG